MYNEIGQPPVTRQSCWDIYRQLLHRFHTLDDIYHIPEDFDAKWGYALTMARDDYAKEIELLPNLRPLRNGDSVIGPGGFYYMGGVNGGEGLGELILFMHVASQLIASRHGTVSTPGRNVERR
jgi:hypothetical protein